MDGSSSNSRPRNPSLPPPPTLYQAPPAPGRQSHYQSLLQDHPLGPDSSSALSPIPPLLPTSSPPIYHQLYNHPGVYYTPPFVPGLDSFADPIQQQPRIAQDHLSHPPEWQPDQLVRSCPICDSVFTMFFRRHHCRKCGRVVCAQCSQNRLTLASAAVVRPPGEVPPAQGLDSLGLPSSAQWGVLGGSVNNPTGSGTSNRHSWAGSITAPVDQNSVGFFDWRTNEDPPPGMEDVRVCSDCFSSSSPRQNECRSASGSTASIHRTWNGSSSSTAQGRPSASELWTPAGVNTPDSNWRRRRQSLQGGRSLPYNYDPSMSASRQNSTSYMPLGSASGSNYSLPAAASTPQSQSQHHNPVYSILPQLQTKNTNYFATRERMFGLGVSSSQYEPPLPHIPQSSASQRNIPQVVQPQNISPPHVQPHAPPNRGRAKLKETDYCPICTLPLPPPHPETGDESAREVHIQDCIRSHEASSSPRNHPSTTATSSGRDAIALTPGGMNMMEFLRQSSAAPAKASGRMVVYKAREEDTWDYSSEDGKGDVQIKVSSSNTMVIDLTGDEVYTVTTTPPSTSAKGKCRRKAECVICFEEFEVGESIARLECLCRYHESCIREWFDRKGNGDCPVHAVRE